jgi:hypothetical protein
MSWAVIGKKCWITLKHDKHFTNTATHSTGKITKLLEDSYQCEI